MILFLLLLGISVSASAQMVDLMGSLAIDGVMNAQAAREYSVANLQMKKNKLAQDLQIKNMEIQTLMLTNPKNVSRETFFVAGYPATAQTESDSGFSITVKGIEKALYQGIEHQFAGSKKVEKNKNNIKFYY